MSNLEIGSNFIPQNTNFRIRFEPVTRDGSTFAFSSVGAWIFALSPSFTGTPLILKSSTGTLSSGDFTIVSPSSSVSVLVRASELSNGFGTYYINLYADTSGSRITHLQKSITVQQSLSTSGV